MGQRYKKKMTQKKKANNQNKNKTKKGRETSPNVIVRMLKTNFCA